MPSFVVTEPVIAVAPSAVSVGLERVGAFTSGAALTVSSPVALMLTLPTALVAVTVQSITVPTSVPVSV